MYQGHGQYLDGKRAKPQKARVSLAQGRLKIVMPGRSFDLPLSNLEVEDLGSAGLRLNLEEGASLTLNDAAARQALAAARAFKREWHLSRRFSLSLLGTVLALLLAFGAVFGLGWGLDPLLKWSLRKLPPSTEAKIFRDLAVAQFKAKAIHDDASARALRKASLAVSQQLPPYEILILADESANAFALPGGVILVHRGLLKRLKSQDEFFALLGHEACHLRERHALRRLARGAALSVVLAAVLGDVRGLGGTLGREGALLLDLRFSRRDEEEADQAALETLKRLNLDPAAAARLFGRLEEAQQEGIGLEIPTFLSTHPNTQERKEKLQAAAKAEPAGAYSRVLSEAEWKSLKDLKPKKAMKPIFDL